MKNEGKVVYNANGRAAYVNVSPRDRRHFRRSRSKGLSADPTMGFRMLSDWVGFSVR